MYASGPRGPSDTQQMPATMIVLASAFLGLAREFVFVRIPFPCALACVRAGVRVHAHAPCPRATQRSSKQMQNFHPQVHEHLD